MSKTIRITKPGSYAIPDEVYFGDFSDPRSINASALKIIVQDGLPAYWEQSPYNPNRLERADSEALRFGRLLHMAIFEPNRFSLSVDVAPSDDFRTKAAREWLEGKDASFVLKPRELEQIEGMRSALLAVPQAAGVMTGGEPERSYYDLRKDLGVFVKSKIDYAPLQADRFIADLKSTASVWDFEDKALADYRYDIQAAVQIDTFRNVTGIDPRGVIYFALAKQRPYTTRLLYIDLKNEEDRALIQRARDQYTAALHQFAEASNTGKWLGEKGHLQRLLAGASPWLRRRIEKDLEETVYE